MQIGTQNLFYHSGYVYATGQWTPSQLYGNILDTTQNNLKVL